MNIKSKNFLVNLSGIIILIMVVILYFLLYLFPALKSINRYKRQLKDMNQKITDFEQVETDFVFSEARERGYFEQVEQELSRKIPTIKTPEDSIALITKISGYIKERARRDGISNLVLESDSKELSVIAGTLSTQHNKSFGRSRNLFSKRFLVAEGKSDGAANTPGVDSGLSALVKNAKFRVITLSFNGELKNAANFINHIPWSEYYLSEDKIVVSAGDILPNYIVFLKVYYIDMQGES